MSHKVLIVEDEDRMREIMVDFFKASDFLVCEAADGRQALEVLEEESPDIVILDIMLPEVDGWSICRYIREKSGIPVILVTARSAEHDKLMGYELGADDYVTKPFSVKVLVAKTKNLILRSKGTLGKPEESSVIEAHGIQIDKEAHTVTVEGAAVLLSPKEYELLLYMIENQRRVLTRDEILNNIWGYAYFGEVRVVDNHVKKLRKKLGEKHDLIQTVIKVGYKFEASI